LINDFHKHPKVLKVFHFNPCEGSPPLYKQHCLESNFSSSQTTEHGSVPCTLCYAALGKSAQSDSPSQPQGKESYNTLSFKIIEIIMIQDFRDAVIKICHIYDWDGNGEVDLFFLGDVMYALGMNITKKVCVGLGQTGEEGKKFAKYGEIVEKVISAKVGPDSSGAYSTRAENSKKMLCIDQTRSVVVTNQGDIYVTIRQSETVNMQRMDIRPLINPETVFEVEDEFCCDLEYN
jgi:hypothetical protein